MGVSVIGSFCHWKFMSYYNTLHLLGGYFFWFCFGVQACGIRNWENICISPCLILGHILCLG